MGFKYKITSSNPYFLTFTVVDWIDVFTRRVYKDEIVNSLKYCQEKKGLELYAWVIMTNHIHLIAAAEEDKSLSFIFRDMKKFTSKKIVRLIRDSNESRKEWMLDKFEFKARFHSKIEEYQFWQEGMHPVELDTNYIIDQKLEYIHQNPVKAGLVSEPEHYLYSSAIDYCGRKGLLDIIHLE